MCQQVVIWCDEALIMAMRCQLRINREANSNLLASVTGPVHAVTNTWDPTRNVLDLKENTVGAIEISSYDYSVNSIGQRTSVATSGTAFSGASGWSWGYDSLGQVTLAEHGTNSNFHRSYAYDDIGNRLKTAESLTLPTSNNYTPTALNQYTSVTEGSAGVSPAYDSDGNMTSGPLPVDPESASSLTWDAENRLISATVDSTTVTYTYDAQSRRIATTVGTNTTLVVYDAWNPIAEYLTLDLQTFDLQRSYTWGLDLSGSMQGAGGVGGLLVVTDHGSLSTDHFFPTYDGNGNVSEYLDDTGAIVAHYEYDPFGRIVVESGSQAADFAHRFSTKPVDSVTGLLYYGYRWYDPVTGRWPSRDPIGENGGINLYGFVRNNGVNMWDVLGLQSFLFPGPHVRPPSPPSISPQPPFNPQPTNLGNRPNLPGQYPGNLNSSYQIELRRKNSHRNCCCTYNGDCSSLPDTVTVRIMIVSANSGSYSLLQFSSNSGVQTHLNSQKLPIYYDACDGQSDMIANNQFTIEVPIDNFGDQINDDLKNRDHNFGTW